MTFPNQLTILRILLTPFFIATLFYEDVQFRFLALILFFVASLTDWYDGYIARKFGTVTKWGKFLDPLADKILILSTFIAFAIIGQVQIWMVVVIAGRDIMITGLRIYAARSERPLATTSFAKWKTVSQMASIYLILLFLLIKHKMAIATEQSHWIQKLESIHVIDKIMYFVTFVTATTGVHYLFENRHHLKGIASTLCRFFLPTIH